MINKIVYISLFWLTISSVAFSQGYVIKDVTFDNDKYTSQSFIKRNVISIKPGDTLKMEEIEKDCRNLSTLPSIVHVTCRFDTLPNNEVKVSFEMDEIISFYPVLNINFTESNQRYLIGGGSLNLFGRNHQIYLAYMNELLTFHSYNIYYKIPFLWDTPFGIAFGTNRMNSEEPLFFDNGIYRYNYLFNNYAIENQYSFAINHSIALETSYFNEQYQIVPNQSLDMFMGPIQHEDDKLSLKIMHKWFNLDYHYHQIDGWNNSLYVQRIYDLKRPGTFNLWVNQFRYYKTIKNRQDPSNPMLRRQQLAFRAIIGTSTNIDSPFAPFVIDSYYNIRGIGTRTDRANGQLVFNAEYRFDTFTFKKNFVNQLVVYSDQGLFRYPGDQISKLSYNNYDHYVGLGTRFLNKRGYTKVIRFDYGVSVKNVNDHGFVLGIGQYF